jgi:hypothetical protein
MCAIYPKEIFFTPEIHQEAAIIAQLSPIFKKCILPEKLEIIAQIATNLFYQGKACPLFEI